MDIVMNNEVDFPIFSTFDDVQPFLDSGIVAGEYYLEDDVWIGTSCVILQGVTVGTGSVIAAGSVVNKSIPANEVWAGVPARFIKKRI